MKQKKILLTRDINLITLENVTNDFLKNKNIIDCKLVASNSDEEGKQIFTILTIYEER